MKFSSGQIVSFRNVGNGTRKYVVKVLEGHQITSISESGNEYIMFPGIRVRPDEHNVSFGRATFYTARTGEIEIVG